MNTDHFSDIADVVTKSFEDENLDVFVSALDDVLTVTVLLSPADMKMLGLMVERSHVSHLLLEIQFPNASSLSPLEIVASAQKLVTVYREYDIGTTKLPDDSPFLLDTDYDAIRTTVVLSIGVRTGNG